MFLYLCITHLHLCFDNTARKAAVKFLFQVIRPTPSMNSSEFNVPLAQEQLPLLLFTFTCYDHRKKKKVIHKGITLLIPSFPFSPHQNLSLFGPAQMMVICHYLFALTLIISTPSSYAGPKHNCHKYRYVTSVCPILMLTSLGLASENMIRYISPHGQGLLELVGELVALF